MSPTSVRHIRNDNRSMIVKEVSGLRVLTCITRYGETMYDGIVEELQEIPKKPGTFYLTNRHSKPSVPISDVLKRNAKFPINQTYNLGTL